MRSGNKHVHPDIGFGLDELVRGYLNNGMGKFEFPCIVLIRKSVMGAESIAGDLDAYGRKLQSNNSEYKNFPPAGKNDQPPSQKGNKMQMDTQRSTKG